MTFPTFEKVFIVFYSTDRMRERRFAETEEAQANEFAKEVNGSVCPMTIKTTPHRTSAQSRKFNNELNRIKKFGYGT